MELLTLGLARLGRRMPAMLAEVTQEPESPSAELEIGACASPRPSRRRRLAACSGPGAGPLALLLFGLAAAALGCAPGERPGTPPRHVLLITVDTLRADHLGAWLYQRPTSDQAGLEEPSRARRSIDRLAGEGVVFSRAFSPRGQTFPALASLFSSRSPIEHGALANRDILSSEIPTLAKSFQAAGFRTGAFTTNRLLVEGSGIEQGFDHFFHDAGEDRDQLAVGNALQWILGQDFEAGGGFFAWVHLMGPHMPYEPAELEGVDYTRLFRDPAYEGDANGSREFLDAAYADGRELSADDVAAVVSQYDGEIARVDHLIGLLTEALSGELSEQPRDLLSDTALIFAADHGEELHQRQGYWGHSKSVYDSVLHVPLFMRHPNSLTGRRVLSQIVELQDVMPTLLDWFQLQPVPGTRGRSLLPLVDTYIERDFEGRPAFGLWGDSIATLRNERWRLIWNPQQVEPDDPPAGPYSIAALELYDHQRDPLELRNLAAEEPERVEPLLLELQAWLSSQTTFGGAGGELSDERLEALIQLGYLGEESAADGRAGQTSNSESTGKGGGGE